MAREITPGLGGGQHKILLFDLAKQRTAAAACLLINLDEPSAGATGDFLSLITGLLSSVSQKHNFLKPRRQTDRGARPGVGL